MEELKGKRIGILVADGFEDLEFFYPLLRFTEAGAEVLTAGLSRETVRGKHGIKFTPGLTVRDLLSERIDCLIIPGGKAPEKLRQDQDVLELVRKSDREGVLVAAICHGPQVIVSAGIAKGRKLTAYSAVKDEIVRAGGDFDYVQVREDGNIITSRFPEDLPAFSKAIIRTLTG